MIKLVVSPDNRLCFDIKQKLAGESFFIANERTAVVKFLKTMLADEKIQIDLNLADNIAKIYLAQILSIISLGKKSGDLIIGKEKINDYLKKNSDIDSAYVIQAIDASDREKFVNNGKLEVCTIFDSAALSKACGKDSTKYALITNKIAELFKKNYSKYNCYIKV